MASAAAPPDRRIDNGADLCHMQAALRLAERHLGDTWPNPSVGCVLVRDGQVVGRGSTRSGGRPHAETEALKMAGAAAKGATAYVSLEPCSHHGKTAPCADALIAADVARVVIAATDPDPRVSGRGIEKLVAAGVAVSHGLMQAEAEHLNAGFFSKVGKGRPLFALKVAATLDGKIALSNGQSHWITGPAARAAAHALRARFDAILTGSGTVIADNPQLTCRMPGYSGRPKIRVVLDRRMRTEADRKIYDIATGPVWLYTAKGGDGSKHAARGADIREIEDADGVGSARAVAADLGARGLTRVLIEAGGGIAASFLRAGLIDECYWFGAPQVIGHDGIGSVAALGLDRLSDAPQFSVRDTIALGPDVLRIMTRKTV